VLVKPADIMQNVNNRYLDCSVSVTAASVAAGSLYRQKTFQYNTDEPAFFTI